MSPANFRKYRDQISDYLNNLPETRILTNIILGPTVNNIKKDPSACNHCQKICPSLHKCLSRECDGLCQDCFETMKDICPGCQAKQEITCPICLDNYCKDRYLNKLVACGHYICYKCCFRASAMNHPITKCPICRASIQSITFD